MSFASIKSLHKLAIVASVCLAPLVAVGCGSDAAKPAAGEAAQGKMSPEDVQKELQKISPPAAGKGKAKAK